MAKYGIDLKMLETLPTGVAAALREHIVACQASPPTAWNKALLHLVGREDLHSLATENWNRHVDPVTISVSEQLNSIILLRLMILRTIPGSPFRICTASADLPTIMSIIFRH